MVYGALRGIQLQYCIRSAANWDCPMGEIQVGLSALLQRLSLKAEFQNFRVTSDGGRILGHELDERLGFGELIKHHLTNSLGNAQFYFVDLLQQSVYSCLPGYEDMSIVSSYLEDCFIWPQSTSGSVVLISAQPQSRVENRLERHRRIGRG